MRERKRGRGRERVGKKEIDAFLPLAAYICIKMY